MFKPTYWYSFIFRSLDKGRRLIAKYKDKEKERKKKKKSEVSQTIFAYPWSSKVLHTALNQQPRVLAPQRKMVIHRNQ